MAVFSHDAARRHYNKFGARQDRQAWYEKPALDLLVTHGAFDDAGAVCEFGAGTGALMARLFESHLPAHAVGLGLDISDVMIALAKDRLKPWAARVNMIRTGGEPVIPAADGAMDRVISAYVLDLLAGDDIAVFLTEARRVLKPDGRLCLAGITPGTKGVSRAVSWVWGKVHGARPSLVGGCRPIRLVERLTDAGWHIRFRDVVAPYGITSEVIIAETG